MVQPDGPKLTLRKVVLYKHGVGYFEREGRVAGDATLSLTFEQAEVSDVLKSLTVLDLDGGHIVSVSYESTKPLAQLLANVALSVPDENSLVGLLPQLKGARLGLQPAGEPRVEGVLLGVDTREQRSADGIVRLVLVSLLGDDGSVRQFDLADLTRLEILDSALRRELDYVLKTQLGAKKKDARTFTFFARGEGERAVRLSYTLEAPVWKATYRVLLGEHDHPPLIQGWAVVDNTQDEDWEGVELSLVSGLPVSFVHDLYTPRYIRRPTVAVAETTGVLPPEVESGMRLEAFDSDDDEHAYGGSGPPAAPAAAPMARFRGVKSKSAASSMPAQVRERVLGDLFEYAIEHPVTIRRNQSALVPIVLRPFEGRSALLHNRNTRPGNPMRAVEFANTTGLTLEGGPLTVLEGGSYVGEAMLDTIKPDEKKLIPYAVELSVAVLDNVESHSEHVHRVVIRDGQLTRHSRAVRQTTYHFDNKSPSEHVVFLDHPREGAGWRLHDTPEPVETTENYWRFRFKLPGEQVTRFVVKQQQPTAQLVTLGSWGTQNLSLWLDQKHIDQRTEGVLRQVVAAQSRVAALDQRLVRLEEERTRIAQEQGRIRDNLAALGDRASEKELRERFIRTLTSQEDRLEAIGTEANAATAERTAAREEVARLLDSLEYEGAVKA